MKQSENVHGVLPDIKLRFDIEHPSFEECYLFGYECAVAEIDENENPYASGTPESEQWLDGWWDGFYGEKPLFESPVSKDEENITKIAANDGIYQESKMDFLIKILEITGVIAVSAFIGYQMIELVA